MVWFVVYGGLLLGVFTIKFNVNVVRLVGRMATAETRLDFVDNGAVVLTHASEYQPICRWAATRGFAPVGIVDFFGILGRARTTTGLWRSTQHKTLLISYLHRNQRIYEFVSALEEGKRLCSSNNVNALSFPDPPWVYIQAFSNTTLDELFEKHCEGLAYLRDRKGLSAIDRPDLTQEFMCESLRRRAEHIRTLFLWQLRGPYWFFIRKQLQKNRSIAQRYPGGGGARTP